MARKLICELIGTFTLTFIGAGAILTTAWRGGEPGLVGIALAHGLALSIAVSATMNISGGHINPAVTLAMFVTGRIRPGPALAYIIAQCAGAMIAGLILAAAFKGLPAAPTAVGKTAIVECLLGTPSFSPANISIGMAVAMEAILTFLLVFAIFGTAVDPRAPHIGGFGIGLTVCFDILAAGPLTGAAMNPARVLGPLLAGGSVTSQLWSQHWVYWVGPVAGAIVAALLYDRVILDRRPA